MTQKTKLMVEMKVLEHGEMGEESIGPTMTSTGYRSDTPKIAENQGFLKKTLDSSKLDEVKAFFWLDNSFSTV